MEQPGPVATSGYHPGTTTTPEVLMARPRLPLGTAGKITVVRNPRGGGWKARCSYRDPVDGFVRQMERYAATKAAAEYKMREAIRDREYAGRLNSLGPDSLFTSVVQHWLERYEKENDPTYNTMRVYRNAVARIEKHFSGIRARELTPQMCAAFIHKVSDESGKGAAQSAKTVMSGTTKMAVVYGILGRNVMAEIPAVRVGSAREQRVLDLPQAIDLRLRIHADPRSEEAGIADIADLILATGWRPAEVPAVRWEDVETATGLVACTGTIVKRVKDERGVAFRQPFPKGKKHRSALLPVWMAERMEALEGARPDEDNRDGVIWVRPDGELITSEWLGKKLKPIFKDAGYGWVTPKIWRATVATLIDSHPDMSAADAAEQLGHASTSTTKKYYIRSLGKPSEAAAKALAGIA